VRGLSSRLSRRATDWGRGGIKEWGSGSLGLVGKHASKGMKVSGAGVGDVQQKAVMQISKVMICHGACI